MDGHSIKECIENIGVKQLGIESKVWREKLIVFPKWIDVFVYKNWCT